MTDPKITMDSASPDWTALLATATDGLLYPSETDAPVAPVVWDGPGNNELSVAAVLRRSGHPAGSTVEEITAEAWFGRVTQIKEWYDEVGRERARRFTALQALMREHLRGLRVFRVGTIAIDVYVIGVDPAGRLAGVSTKVVET